MPSTQQSQPINNQETTTIDLPTLRLGQSGLAIRMLQRVLTCNGYYDQFLIDGIFGYRTDAAVIAFQQDHRLVADGIVGAKTWNQLSKVSIEPGC